MTLTVVATALTLLSLGTYLSIRHATHRARHDFHQQMDAIAHDERRTIINHWARPELPCQARPVQLPMTPAPEETR